MSGLFLVSGLGRCGTSLLMQMLAAGGAPICPGASWPDFEHDANTGEDMLPDRAAGMLKWLDPQRFPPPYFERAVFLTRDHTQQAKSQLKMLGMVHVTPDRAGRRRMRSLLESDERRAKAALHKRCSRVICLRFEHLITEPARVFSTVVQFLGLSLDSRKALDCVRPRETDCLPYMLEERILAEGPRA